MSPISWRTLGGGKGCFDPCHAEEEFELQSPRSPTWKAAARPGLLGEMWEVAGPVPSIRRTAPSSTQLLASGLASGRPHHENGHLHLLLFILDLGLY